MARKAKTEIAPPKQITLRVLREFGSEFVARSGLAKGKTLKLYSYPSTRAGKIWVMCPPVTRRVRGESVTRSDGWYELEAGEWEEVEA